MIKKHKYFYLPSLLIMSCMSSVFAQIDSTNYKQVTSKITATKAIYAPDKRTKLLELVNADLPNNTYHIQSTEESAISYLKNELKDLHATFTYTLLPDTSILNKNIGVINLSVANMRTRPGHDAEMATQAILGTQVDILQKNKGEYRVRTPEGYISWVPTASVTAFTPVEFENWKNAKKIIYTAEFGKSYSKPNKNSVRVSDLVYGNILALTKETKGFYEVKYPDGRIAFIPKEEALSFEKWINSRSLTAENILSSAKTMMGLPYLWGGTSVKGVDCSGFTKTSFFMNGYIIPRDASQQVLAGDKVEILDANGHLDTDIALENLKPADLLFFAAGKANSPNARVTHVALYIGNGEFIHAAGTVRINSIVKTAANYDDFQTRTVVAARRYLGAADKQIEKIKDNTYYTK